MRPNEAGCNKHVSSTQDPLALLERFNKQRRSFRSVFYLSDAFAVDKKTFYGSGPEQRTALSMGLTCGDKPVAGKLSVKVQNVSTCTMTVGRKDVNGIVSRTDIAPLKGMTFECDLVAMARVVLILITGQPVTGNVAHVEVRVDTHVVDEPVRLQLYKNEAVTSMVLEPRDSPSFTQVGDYEYEFLSGKWVGDTKAKVKLVLTDGKGLYKDVALTQYQSSDYVITVPGVNLVNHMGDNLQRRQFMLNNFMFDREDRVWYLVSGYEPLETNETGRTDEFNKISNKTFMSITNTRSGYSGVPAEKYRAHPVTA